MKPLILWIISDGKSGHENQSLGLAEAIARRTPSEIHHISLVGKRGLFARLRAAFCLSAGFPKPSMILAAGHATHPVLLALAKKHGATSIVLMKPSLPLSWFDVCIAPKHDFPDGSAHPHLILTHGALNRVTPSTQPKTGKLILIGGPSKTHSWDSTALLNQLTIITDRSGWEISDSRRTPADFLATCRARLPGVICTSYQDTPPGWVTQKLQCAKEVWVTEDSVSMIYEALTSGANVGLLPVPRLKAESRVLSGIDALIADGFLTPFSTWQKTGLLATAPKCLSEADRCASHLFSPTA